jgi:hypothetical protein
METKRLWINYLVKLVVKYFKLKQTKSASFSFWNFFRVVFRVIPPPPLSGVCAIHLFSFQIKYFLEYENEKSLFFLFFQFKFLPKATGG